MVHWSRADRRHESVDALYITANLLIHDNDVIINENVRPKEKGFSEDFMKPELPLDSVSSRRYHE
jgi:hypothetical protein